MQPIRHSTGRCGQLKNPKNSLFRVKTLVSSLIDAPQLFQPQCVQRGNVVVPCGVIGNVLHAHDEFTLHFVYIAVKLGFILIDDRLLLFCIGEIPVGKLYAGGVRKHFSV